MQEKEAAAVLAKAEDSKRQAARALDQEMGLGQRQQAEPSQGASPNKVLFKLDIDEDFFAGLSDLECEGSGREALQAMGANLRQTKGMIDGERSAVKE